MITRFYVEKSNLHLKDTTPEIEKVLLR